MVDIQKKTQGISGEWNYRKQLSKMFNLDNIFDVTLATAFLNEEGVRLISKEIEKIANYVTAYIGVRNSVTTFQGVLGLINLGVKVYAIDCGSPAKIYHEKTYTVRTSSKAIVLTGSGNLTRGGLISNIESGTIIECNLSSNEDSEFYNSFKEQLALFVNEFPKNVYLIDDISKAIKLKEDGVLLDENKVLPKRVSGVSESKKTTFEVPMMRTFVEKVNKGQTKQELKDKLEITVPESNESESVLLKYVELWKSKNLKERDLNIPKNPGTNVTGSMLLKKGSYEIDQQTYFYEEAFKNLKWKKGTGKRDVFMYAEAHFDFLIDGVFIKGEKLKLKHDTRTDTTTFKQKQPMTHLIWGDSKKLISNSNLLGEIMTIYKNIEKDDNYLIQIQEEV